MEFLDIPDTYYNELRKRLKKSKVNLGSVWGPFGPFGVRLGSVWGPFGV